jgi:hypothetical protein
MANAGRYLARSRMLFPLMFEPALIAETGDYVFTTAAPVSGFVLEQKPIVFVAEHQPQCWVAETETKVP